MRYESKTFWLTQKQIAGLLDMDRSVIPKHLGNVFDEGEPVWDSVCADFAHTAPDGRTYQVQFYALDAVIAVGYLRIGWRNNVIKLNSRVS